MEKGVPKAVGIWIRVSTEDQAKGESPEHHERRAHYYAESKGWQVREVYHLEAVSARDHAEQVAFALYWSGWRPRDQEGAHCSHYRRSQSRSPT